MDRETFSRMKINYEKRLEEQARTGGRDLAAPCINLRGLLRHQTQVSEAFINDYIFYLVWDAIEDNE